MKIEVGTLKEIGAQVGDVVAYDWDHGCVTQLIATDEMINEWITDTWRIISRANQGPVREVTRKEIVPGVYGPLTIRATGELGPVQLEINGSVGRTWFSKSDVDALLTTLTAIRDAMADSSSDATTAQAR